MKILLMNAEFTDYISVNILHGLVTLNHEVDEYYYMDYMRSYNKDKYDDLSVLYGRGYSYAFTLNDNNERIDDKSIIKNRIAEHYYDLIIYSTILHNNAYLDLVLEKYKLGEIFIIDAYDMPSFHQMSFSNNIIYFKRELYNNNFWGNTPINIYPINFAIPKEKFQEKNYYKQNILVNDCNKEIIYDSSLEENKYQYFTEKEYYDHYNQSVFALTGRKAGFDCMRHYEIIACHCLPVFMDFDMLPRTVMTTWPTVLQQQANSLYVQHRYGYVNIYDDKIINQYFKILDEFYDYAYNNLTTENLVNYLLNFC